MDENLKARARALCAADIAALKPSLRERDLAVDRYWPVVAVEITGNLSVPDAIIVPANFRELQEEYRRLRTR
jgi:hypothetical protein